MAFSSQTGGTRERRSTTRWNPPVAEGIWGPGRVIGPRPVSFLGAVWAPDTPSWAAGRPAGLRDPVHGPGRWL